MSTCPACHAITPIESWQYHEHHIFACPSCDLHFVNPLKGGSLDYYRSHYGAVINSAITGELHPGLQFTLEKLKQLVATHLMPHQRRVIDIGCGPGYLLYELKKLGFDEFGLDFNPAVIQVAHEHYHVRAQVGTVEGLIQLSARFDLALLIHVLEHVETPHELLATIRQILAPQGILFIDVPNRQRFGLRRSITRGHLEEGEYPPHHLTFWSIQALSQLLQSTGYHVLECQARPLGSEGQIELFLKHHFEFLPTQLSGLLAKVLRGVGQTLRLQGTTLFAVARRQE